MTTSFSIRSSLLTAFLVLLPAASPLLAWGAKGHRILAAVAEHHLDAATEREIAVLIGPETLVDVSTWADDIKSDPAWNHAYNWHFVNFPDGVDPAGRDVHPDGDVLTAIDDLAGRLADRSLDRSDRAEALRFLVHFVGDIHQPLHVGRSEDRGGNRFEVQWFRAPKHLHWVWDSGLVDSKDLSYTEYAAELLRRPVESRPFADPLEWARESRALLEQVYAVGEDRDLWYPYIYANRGVAEERLIAGGERLAQLFERILTDGAAGPEIFVAEVTAGEACRVTPGRLGMFLGGLLLALAVLLGGAGRP